MGLKANTIIKKDKWGLYVSAGGWIARPFWGTCFKEGDKVRSHHFGGSVLAGVTTEGNTFKSSGMYEHWCTTGIISYQYKNLRDEEIEENIKWYKNFASCYNGILLEKNEEFANFLKNNEQ